MTHGDAPCYATASSQFSWRINALIKCCTHPEVFLYQCPSVRFNYISHATTAKQTNETSSPSALFFWELRKIGKYHQTAKPEWHSTTKGDRGTDREFKKARRNKDCDPLGNPGSRKGLTNALTLNLSPCAREQRLHFLASFELFPKKKKQQSRLHACFLEYLLTCHAMNCGKQKSLRTLSQFV